MKYFTTKIEYQNWNLKLQRVFSPFNLIFNAEFQKINAEIPFTPSYLEPWFHYICTGLDKKNLCKIVIIFLPIIMPPPWQWPVH